MSSSLPRIKTVHETGTRNISSSTKDLKVKFRKIALEQFDNKEQRKKSITVVRTERLKTLQRFTTIQEKRQYKNEKIHLNLIERKLLSGTYDQKKQTSSQLTGIKQKRDQMKVEMNLKQKEIDRIKLLLDDVKQEINDFMSKRGQHEEKLKEIKEKLENQLIKTENARENKMVLESMIKARHQANLILNKRCNNINEHSQQLVSGWSLADIELRQASQRCSTLQSKLQYIFQLSNKQRSERNDEIIKHQQKINKRRDGEVMHVQKSKQYVAQLDNMEHITATKEFHQIYDKILPNIFVARYSKLKMIKLMAKYSNIEKLYAQIVSYKAFDADNPSQFVKRFFEHEPEYIQWQEQIKQKQNYLSKLQQRSQQLKKDLVFIQTEYVQNEYHSKQNEHAESLSKERQQKKEIKEEVEELDDKYVRVKSYILKMLGMVNQKGQKNIYSGIQPTINNLTLLTTIIRQSYNKLN